MEDVDDDFEVIEDDPLTRRKPVDRRSATIVVVSQPRFDLIGYGFKLRLGTGRANDKEIGEAGNTCQIQNDNVFRLFVGGELGAGRG